MFGYVARRDENEPLGKILHLKALGRRPPGRPKKTWSRNVEEDMTRGWCYERRSARPHYLTRHHVSSNLFNMRQEVVEGLSKSLSGVFRKKVINTKFLLRRVTDVFLEKLDLQQMSHLSHSDGI